MSTQEDTSVRFQIIPEAATEQTTHFTFAFQDESMAFEFSAAVSRQPGGKPTRDGCSVSVPVKGVVKSFINTENRQFVVEFKTAKDAKRWQEFCLLPNGVGSSDIQLLVPRKWKRTAFIARLQDTRAPMSEVV
jgi:hypothetical protein